MTTLQVLELLYVHVQGDEDSGEESEEDDGFFVPHGYLSEDEGERSDSERGPDGDEVRVGGRE